ncbi:MAG: polysaccharide deacetylase family protein [Acidobacteriia bacterium]|nr:polysaccharide deacetylase family protein [Terriglobia bacterium]
MVWLAASAVVLAMGATVLWYAASVPSSQVFGPALVRGPAESGGVVLTFDDGPASPFTEQILDLLRDHQVPAVFFVNGRNAERHAGLLRRIAAEGHAIGNHSYSHLFPYLLTRRRMAEEIDRAQEVIERITGQRPVLFRPPYGARWFGLYPALRERGLQVVQWSDTGYDWKPTQTEDAIVRSSLEKLRPGGILLLHDGLEGYEGFWRQAWRGRNDRQTPAGSPAAPARTLPDRTCVVRALPRIIEGARKMGLRFVPIQDFIPA